MEVHEDFKILKALVESPRLKGRRPRIPKMVDSKWTFDKEIGPDISTFAIPFESGYLLDAMYYAIYDPKDAGGFNTDGFWPPEGYIEMTANELIIDRIPLRAIPFIYKLYHVNSYENRLDY